MEKNHAIVKVDFVSSYDYFEGAWIYMMPISGVGVDGPKGVPATQFLYQLKRARYTTGQIIAAIPAKPELPAAITNVFAALGYRYLLEPLGEAYPCPIDKGVFQRYNRIEDADMPYEH
ncbi:hypothetical protein O1611_g1486 [Lasiodiplodia mahajangana]|uniref:Uncharacterized protein n=1 Tax=Lasiodiplodia mahajangana TaxID=1108764 RepID=A0ACC2JX90_9PEZI|nr:hypothetical protein O1611_g1486 [Lasiodiplodia mahajangana]